MRNEHHHATVLSTLIKCVCADLHLAMPFLLVSFWFVCFALLRLYMAMVSPLHAILCFRARARALNEYIHVRTVRMRTLHLQFYVINFECCCFFFLFVLFASLINRLHFICVSSTNHSLLLLLLWLLLGLNLHRFQSKTLHHDEWRMEGKMKMKKTKKKQIQENKDERRLCIH